MTERRELKAAARQAIREAKPSPVLVALMVVAVTAVLVYLSMSINGTIDMIREMIAELRSGTLTEYITADGTAEEGSLFGSLIVFALNVMTTVISVGFVLYCLRVSRRIQASFGDVFDAFGLFLRAFVLRFLRGLVLLAFEIVLVVALSFLTSAVLIAVYQDGAEEALYALAASPWAALVLLLYIPVFIASYFYRLADYFLLDHPEMTCVQCLTMSRMAMRGHKRELFRLDLSFLGWFILCIIPVAILWVKPYFTVTMAGFYEKRAPAFLEELQQRMEQQAQQPPGPGHGYSVPGQRDDDEEE